MIHDTSARTGLVLMCALTGALLLAIVGGCFDAANARARDATSYAWGTGPHPSGLAMWSEDGEHWRKV